MTGTAVKVRRTRNGGAVVAVRGDLDTTATAELRRGLLHAVLHSRCRTLCVDLHEAAQIAAEGIGAIVATAQIAADRHLPMTVSSPTSEIAQRLRAAGLPLGHIQTRYQRANRHFLLWLV